MPLKKKHRFWIPLGILAAVAALGGGIAYLTAGQALATEQCLVGQERREALNVALENGDYQGWLKIMQCHPKLEDVISEEDFDKLAEAHRLRQEGKYEEARALMRQIRERVGFFGRGMIWGYRLGRGVCNGQ